MSLPEILQWVKFGQKTGTIVFEHRGIVKKVFAEDGLIVSASSNDPKEYLGQILICFGWITEDVLNEAFKKQASSGMLLGKILSEHYGIKPDQIMKALRIKIEETVYNLFLWEDGKFIYSNGISQLRENDRLEAAITIDQVTFEGARRNDEWVQFKKEFPTDDVVFGHKGGTKSGNDVSKDFIVQKIYQSVDGNKTIRGVLLDTHAPEYRGFEAIAKLYWSGFIEPLKKSVAKPVKTVEDGALKRAMELYKQKEWEKAYSIIEHHLATKPDDEEAITLFNVVRESLFKQLYSLIPPDGIPELTIDISELSEKVFSSREGFIASRVNGQWDIKSLVMISPLGELESLQILKRLMDEGVIRLKKK